MDSEEIFKKSVSGAKWTVFLSVIAMPINYATNIIIGRISPESLGIYGLLNIFILFINTFIFFGGGNVIIKYLPEIKDGKKTIFLISYTLIVFFIAIFIIVIIYFYPQITYILFAQMPSVNMIYALIIFMPIIICYSICNFSLNGLMEIKLSVIIRQIIVYNYFIVFLILAIFFKNFLYENFCIIILVLSFIQYTVLGLISFYLLMGKVKIMNFDKNVNKNLSFISNDADNPFRMIRQTFAKLRNFRPYLPGGFWRFALLVHASTILGFFYDKIDQLLIVKYFSINELGLYYAALQTATMIRLIPMLIGSVLLPTFSNLLASNEISLVQKGYQEVVRYNTLIVIPISLFCIFFSSQIMRIFGPEYEQNHLILAVLAIFYSFTPMVGINYSLLIAKGKSGMALANSIMQVGIQVLLMLIFLNSLGILGLAIGRGAGVALSQIGLLYIVVKRLDLNLIVPKSFKMGIVISVASSILYIYILPQNILISSFMFLVFTLSFILLGGYSRKDFDFVIKTISKNH